MDLFVFCESIRFTLYLHEFRNYHYKYFFTICRSDFPTKMKMSKLWTYPVLTSRVSKRSKFIIFTSHFSNAAFKKKANFIFTEYTSSKFPRKYSLTSPSIFKIKNKHERTIQGTFNSIKSILKHRHNTDGNILQGLKLKTTTNLIPPIFGKVIYYTDLLTSFYPQ